MIPNVMFWTKRSCTNLDRNALNGSDGDTDTHHAIWTVLSTMAWADVAFAALAELALKDENSPLNNPLIGEALINGHVVTQILALRRLMDESSGTISLVRLLRDVKKHLALLTRENFVCHDGIPYDYEAVSDAERASRPSGHAVWIDTTGPFAYGTSALLHRQFDRLSGTNPSSRARTDQIPKRIIVALEKMLEESGARVLAKWSHTFVAHAGDAGRREEIRDIRVTTHEITKAAQALARVAEGLSGYVLGIGGLRGGVVPSPQFDVFQNLERPIIDASSRAAVEAIWGRAADQWENSLEGVDEELAAIMP